MELRINSFHHFLCLTGFQKSIKCKFRTSLDQVTGSDMDYSVTKYDYNHLGNLKTYIDPMNQSESYDYDFNGNLTTKTDRSNSTMASTYDGFNRLTFKAITDGIKTNTSSINYTKIGLVKEKNVNGYLESFEYTD